MSRLNKIASWYFSKNALPYWITLLMDCALLLVSNYAVYFIGYGAEKTISLFLPLLGTFSFYLIFYLIGFRMFHTYSGVLRFSSFVDLRKVASAVGIGVLLQILWLSEPFWTNTWLVKLQPQYVIVSALMAVCLMWGVRVCVKGIYEATLKNEVTENIFIFGVKEGGVALAKSICNTEQTPFSLVGFVGDTDDLEGRFLMGTPVYQNDAKLVDVMKSKNATTLIVSPLKANALHAETAMVDSLINAGIRIMTFPGVQEWHRDQPLNLKQLREIKVEDLLPRNKIEIDMESISSDLNDKRILITGAAGSIGAEIVRQVAEFHPAEMILVDQAETPLHDIRLMMANKWGYLSAHTIVCDITNKARMEDIFATFKPEYVYHAAAYKHVPMMEDNPIESILNNVAGTCIVADLAVKYGTNKFVMVSTDKAVNPTNVMGCSKRICEIYVQSLDKAIKDGNVAGVTNFITTRFGNVLGSNGSVIPLFERQIKAGGPVTVTHPDIIRFFMLIPEACKLVLEAGTMGNGGEIFVFDMGEPVKIADLAKRMIKLSGADNVEIRYTGLRDGEKLYEEVLNEQEITVPTFHEKIKIAHVREYDYATVSQQINSLIAICDEANDMKVVAMMKHLVPEFISKHSKYESLDKK